MTSISKEKASCMLRVHLTLVIVPQVRANDQESTDTVPKLCVYWTPLDESYVM